MGERDIQKVRSNAEKAKKKRLEITVKFDFCFYEVFSLQSRSFLLAAFRLLARRKAVLCMWSFGCLNQLSTLNTPLITIYNSFDSRRGIE